MAHHEANEAEAAHQVGEERNAGDQGRERALDVAMAGGDKQWMSRPV